jgi:hypothetical protein
MHRIRYLIGSLTLLFAIAGAWWLVHLVQHLDDRPGLPLTVEFREARGLRAGADVRYRGVNVGVVRSIVVSPDGTKATAQLLLDPPGAAHARVDSTFWIVTPRFAGLTAGASGLDTLVRDSYVAFLTPAEGGSPLVAGSLIAGRERPPAASEGESLEEIEHGDLLMTLLVPENHGLKPGSAVIFRGVQTGDVRAVALAPSGTHVEATLRIARRYRQTVTDKTAFWVARPYVSGALFSGFTVTDVSALLTPYVSYYGEPGKGVLVQDGWRAAADATRPAIEISPVPADALRQQRVEKKPPPAGVVLVHITYAAIERDALSADDPLRRQGSGVLFLDRAGRAVVVTARSLVDGAFTETDLFGGDPEVDDEQIKALLADGTVLRAGRVWVDPSGADLAALVLEDAPPDLGGTPAAKFVFGDAPPGDTTLRTAGPDGAVQSQAPPAAGAPAPGEVLGGAICAGDQVVAIQGRPPAPPASLQLLPEDLRPR